MRAKECLSCDRFMPSATDCSHSEPSVSHVATGPIVLRRDSNPHHPKRASYRVEDEAMLRIRCWRSGSVRLLRCRPAPRPSFHSAPIWQRAGGGVDIIFRKNMSGSGRCNGYGSQLWREPTVASFPFRQTFEPDLGGVDAVASAGAFAGVRTRTGQFLRLLPLPVGLRKHVRIPPLRGRNIRTVHNRSGHSCRILALMLAVDAHTAT